MASQDNNNNTVVESRQWSVFNSLLGSLSKACFDIWVRFQKVARFEKNWPIFEHARVAAMNFELVLFRNYWART